MRARVAPGRWRAADGWNARSTSRCCRRFGWRNGSSTSSPNSGRLGRRTNRMPRASPSRVASRCRSESESESEGERENKGSEGTSASVSPAGETVSIRAPLSRAGRWRIGSWPMHQPLGVRFCETVKERCWPGGIHRAIRVSLAVHVQVALFAKGSHPRRGSRFAPPEFPSRHARGVTMPACPPPRSPVASPRNARPDPCTIDR